MSPYQTLTFQHAASALDNSNYGLEQRNLIQIKPSDIQRPTFRVTLLFEGVSDGSVYDHQHDCRHWRGLSYRTDTIRHRDR